MRKKTISLDIIGQMCPACLLLALKEINRNKGLLRSGKANLIVKTDHRDATRTIPGAASAMGYAVSVAKKETHYEIKIKQKNEDENT